MTGRGDDEGALRAEAGRLARELMDRHPQLTAPIYWGGYGGKIGRKGSGTVLLRQAWPVGDRRWKVHGGRTDEETTIADRPTACDVKGQLHLLDLKLGGAVAAYDPSITLHDSAPWPSELTAPVGALKLAIATMREHLGGKALPSPVGQPLVLPSLKAAEKHNRQEAERRRQAGLERLRRESMPKVDPRRGV